MVNLYELPRDKGIKILCECFKPNPDGSKGEKIADSVTFHHVDGMYSYCTADGVTGKYGSNLVHLSAMTPLELVSDGVYKIVE